MPSEYKSDELTISKLFELFPNELAEEGGYSLTSGQVRIFRNLILTAKLERISNEILGEGEQLDCPRFAILHDLYSQFGICKPADFSHTRRLLASYAKNPLDRFVSKS